jgi:intein/homing endonuclease
LDGVITKVTGKNCYELKVNSRAIKKLFEKCNMWELVSASPKTHVARFIRGFVDAEGYVSKKRARIQVVQKDKKTLQYIQLLLTRFGVLSNLRKRTNAYHLIIDGKDIVKYANEIGMTAKDKSEYLQKWAMHCRDTFARETIPIKRQSARELLIRYGLPVQTVKSRESAYRHINMREATALIELFQAKGIKCREIEFIAQLLASDIRLAEVKGIKKMANKQVLYDIEVPENKNFIANGFLVHNSTSRLYVRKSKDDKRIARLVDSPNLPEGEAVFRVTPKGLSD